MFLWNNSIAQNFQFKIVKLYTIVGNEIDIGIGKYHSNIQYFIYSGWIRENI